MGVTPFTGSAHVNLLTLQYLQAKPTKEIIRPNQFYSCFPAPILSDAPTFIDCLITSFLIFSFRLSANSASSICLWVWHKSPGASWWSALLPLPNQLVSSPSLRRETKSYGVVRKDGGASSHNAAMNASTHDPRDGRRCWCDWWE